MTPAELLTDALERIRDAAVDVVTGLDADQLAARPGPDANSIAWLVWHLARAQDAQVAHVAGLEQVWTAAGFASRFGLDLPDSDTGYGHSSAQVASVHASAEELAAYVRAVHDQSAAFVAGLRPDDLDRVVDRGWDPPVTLGVRLVSIVDDDARHVGQAAYVRGLLGW